METWGNVYCLAGLILTIAGAVHQTGWELGPGIIFMGVGLLAQYFAIEPIDFDNLEEL